MSYTVPERSRLSIAEYESSSAHTDQLADDALVPVWLGLFDKAGSLIASLIASKKYHREDKATVAYRDATIDMLGDTLWYLSALCRRLEYSLEEVMAEAYQVDSIASDMVMGAFPKAPIASVRIFGEKKEFDELLVQLGRNAASLLGISTRSQTNTKKERLVAFTQTYLLTAQACNIPLVEIAAQNLTKTRGRFLDHALSDLPNFDSGFPKEEQIPQSFRIEIQQRKDGKCYSRWNKVFIGGPLTDSIEVPDDYRFHDVFHFAHAAILHWSPTFRAFIRQKRKSQAEFDENQDGGRAIAIEEGLTAYIFACAKELDFFEGQSSISFHLLKTIGRFVQGYEVERCPLKLWEEAILQGYSVFRALRENGGGVVVGSRKDRSISYESGNPEKPVF